MLPYLLTALAGIALGIAAMRVWQARESGVSAEGHPPPIGDASPGAGSDGPAASPLPARRLTPRHALIGAAVLAVAATGLLVLRDADEAEGPGLAASTALASPAGGAGKSVADVDTMIERLEARLKASPNDGEGFRMLGWSYAMTGRPDKAIAPYERALALLPKSALAHSGYGEALVGVAKDVVTPQAKAAFDRAVALDPKEPRARYFLALWQAQHGQEKTALEAWIGLANSGPADAPWQADVRRKITEVSAKLGVDVSGRLKQPAPASPSGAATAGAMPPPLDSQAIAAANAMPEASRQAMVDQMVTSLADKLKANPADPDRWILLLRSRMVLKQGQQATADLGTARAALASNASGLARVNAAARELGVPGA